MGRGATRTTAITIGHHNTQFIINVHLSPERLERWLRMLEEPGTEVSVAVLPGRTKGSQIGHQGTQRQLDLLSKEPPSREGLSVSGTVETVARTP